MKATVQRGCKDEVKDAGLDPKYTLPRGQGEAGGGSAVGGCRGGIAPSQQEPENWKSTPGLCRQQRLKHAAAFYVAASDVLDPQPLWK